MHLTGQASIKNAMWFRNILRQTHTLVLCSKRKSTPYFLLYTKDNQQNADICIKNSYAHDDRFLWPNSGSQNTKDEHIKG
jgi:hypothetical protein